jgi:hypothetical protein
MTGSPTEEIELRAARNQALFRDINERLAELDEHATDATAPGTWSCECADVTCLEQIELTVAEYERLRSEPRRFAVAADERHVLPEVEVVIERTDRYWVVEKTGDAGAEAASLDPREP